MSGVLKKPYLGPASQLDIEVLETVARTFAEPEPVKPPPSPQPPPRRQPTLKFTKTLKSALRIYGFSTIPTRKVLLDKYRELSKQHHPDRGGIHEDMVVVNLAYDYLKQFVNDRR